MTSEDESGTLVEEDLLTKTAPCPQRVELTMKTCILFMLLTSSALAAEPQVDRDLAYSDPADAGRRLDVYAPGDGKDLPVIVWIHGLADDEPTRAVFEFLDGLLTSR